MTSYLEIIRVTTTILSVLNASLIGRYLKFYTYAGLLLQMGS